MQCQKCGSIQEELDKFCSKCGAEVSRKLPDELKNESVLKTSNSVLTRQLSKITFVALIFATTIFMALLLSEKGIGTILLSNRIAQTFAISALGFIAAKLVTKNERRTLFEIIYFQIINISVGFVYLVVSEPNKATITLVFAFVSFSVVFWMQKKLKTK
jgi:hypothetical protein